MKVRAADIRVGDVLTYAGDDMIVPVKAEEVVGITQEDDGTLWIAFDSDEVTFEPSTIVDVDRTSVYYVAVYAISRCFGGPEEGGWWYDSGELVDIRTVEGSRDDAFEVREALRAQYPLTKKRYSVLGGDDWDILVREEMPATHFPTERPHYE